MNTAGAIATALERAFNDGFAHIENAGAETYRIESDQFIEWELLKPRPRAALASICLGVFGSGKVPARGGWLVPHPTENKTPGWMLMTPTGQSHEDAFGGKTIQPLLRDGLLVLADERIEVTPKGEATWRRFRERSEFGWPDETLKEIPASV